MNTAMNGLATNSSGRKLLLTVSGGICIAGILLSLSRAQVLDIKQLANDSQNDPELDTALVALLDNPACPQDPSKVPQFVQDYFPVFFPDLALRERRKDPGFAEAEFAANALMSNPRATRDELIKDPSFAAREQAVMNQVSQWNGLAAGLERQVLEDEVAAWKAKHRSPSTTGPQR